MVQGTILIELKAVSQVTSGMDAALFDAQSIITPTCGIRFADEQGAVAIMETSVLISRHIREHFST